VKRRLIYVYAARVKSEGAISRKVDAGSGFLSVYVGNKSRERFVNPCCFSTRGARFRKRQVGSPDLALTAKSLLSSIMQDLIAISRIEPLAGTRDLSFRDALSSPLRGARASIAGHARGHVIASPLKMRKRVFIVGSRRIELIRAAFAGKRDSPFSSAMFRASRKMQRIEERSPFRRRDTEREAERGAFDNSAPTLVNI